jgi:arylsulfatase A-like enzyme
MRFRLILSWFISILAAFALLPWERAAAAGPGVTKPNIVFILADDLGCMDISPNNPRTFYVTPNLQKLAGQAVRFTDAYAACPVCSPTRASILTGKYPARLHLTDFIGGRRTGKLLPAEYLDHLPIEEFNLARALKEAGYVTAIMGKWHLGGAPFLPESQGFDVNVGAFASGAPSSYFSPYRNPKLADGPAGEYLTDRLTDEAVKFIAATTNRPFFLYLAHYAVHIPLQAKAEVQSMYEAKQPPAAPGGRFLEEGKVRTRQVQDHTTYAAMVQSLDESVGRILKQLDASQMAQRTIVIFFSDNGGLSTAEGSPTSNMPFRGGKGWLYEGGIREPLLIKWPGVAKPGSVCQVPVISTDFYPTLLEMAGLPLRPKQHLDGVSLASLIKTGWPPERKAMFWHYPHYSNQGGPPGCAVRAGDWKLLRFFEDKGVELYNLKNDPGERHDLAAMQPEKISELNALLDGFLKDTGAAMMRPNPVYNPSSSR